MRKMGEQGFYSCIISDYGLPGISSFVYGKPLSFRNSQASSTEKWSTLRAATGPLSVQSSLVMLPIFTYSSKAVSDHLSLEN